MQAQVNQKSETLEEDICATISRDLNNILTKLKYVIVPKFNLQSDPEGAKQLRNCKLYLKVGDLWGPLLLCLLLSMVLNMGINSSGNQFGIVFLIMWGGSFIVTINTKLLGGKVSFFQCVCVLGYCIFPIVLAAVGVFFLSKFGLTFLLLKVAVAVVSLIWSTMASISFMNVMVDEEKNIIAIYPIFLFYLFIAWFVIFI